jgi:hypothetical protein
MRSETADRGGNPPAQAVIKAHGVNEAAKSDFDASGACRRQKNPAEGADASTRRVIRQPR